jgi:hypothetical protein
VKNKVSDVRNHLVAMMESLNDEQATPEQQAVNIERAKAMSSLAQQYVGAVRVELDAVRLFDETRMLPSSVEAPAREEARVLSFDPRRAA